MISTNIIKGLFRTRCSSKPNYGKEWELTPIGYLFKPVEIDLPEPFLWLAERHEGEKLGVIELRNQPDSDLNGRWGIRKLNFDGELSARRFPPIGKGRGDDLLTFFFNVDKLPVTPFGNVKYAKFINL